MKTLDECLALDSAEISQEIENIFDYIACTFDVQIQFAAKAIGGEGAFRLFNLYCFLRGLDCGCLSSGPDRSELAL